MHSHDDKQLKCDLCPKSHSNSSALNYHNRVKHQQPVQKHPCDLCEKHFATMATLNRHKSMKHKSDVQSEPGEECDDCGRKFT